MIRSRWQYLASLQIFVNFVFLLSSADLHAMQESHASADAMEALSLNSSAEVVTLKARHSGKCLDVLNASPAAGAPIVQRECQNTPSQQWQLVDLGEGQSHIVSNMSGLCLDVGGASSADGAAIQQAPCQTSYKHQRWQTRNAVNGSQEIFSINSGKCLDVAYRSNTDDSPIIQWPCSLQNNQLWEKTIVSWPGEPAAISCEQPPEVSVEWTTEWREEIYGRNSLYSNFFTPVTHYKGSSYFIWIDESGYPQVSKITKGKPVVTELLAAKYKARINSHNLFSLGIDKNGYIHISGDMQNGPNERNVDYPERYKKAKILYWVSKQPESVHDGFEFAGDMPRTIPARRVNGIRFFTDHRGELYSSAAVDAIEHGARPGRRGIGLYKYSTDRQVWDELGGKPPRTADTKITDVINKVLFWEVGGVGSNGDWQGFFSFFKFGRDNRLHFATAVNTDRTVDYDNLLLYAVSEDGGNQWKKADGSQIEGLPLRAADGIPSQADLIDEGRFTWQTNVLVDKDGNPGVYVVKVEDNVWNDRWYTWNGSSWTTDNSTNELRAVPRTGNIAPRGSMILTPNQYSKMVYCQNSFTSSVVSHEIGALGNYERFTNIDEYGLRNTGSVYGIAVSPRTGKQSLLKVTFKPTR